MIWHPIFPKWSILLVILFYFCLIGVTHKILKAFTIAKVSYSNPYIKINCLSDYIIDKSTGIQRGSSFSYITAMEFELITEMSL